MNIFEQYIISKKKEVEDKKVVIDPRVFGMSPTYKKRRINLKKHFATLDAPAIIPVFKRTNSNGNTLNESIKAHSIAKEFQQSGAAAIAYATDEELYGVKIEDMRSGRKNSNLPFIRFDVILDEFQIMESKAMGADAVWLNAAAVSEEGLEKLAEKAISEKLTPILEITDEKQLKSIPKGVQFICVSRKTQDTHEVNITFAEKIINKIPKSYTPWISGGFKSIDEVKAAKELGYQGFLVGEFFMDDAAPGFLCQDWVEKISK